MTVDLEVVVAHRCHHNGFAGVSSVAWSNPNVHVGFDSAKDGFSSHSRSIARQSRSHSLPRSETTAIALRPLPVIRPHCVIESTRLIAEGELADGSGRGAELLLPGSAFLGKDISRHVE